MLTQSDIHVVGDDALTFMQAQLTNDLERLDNEPSIYSAWCSPKGRVLWFGRVTKSDNGFVLAAPTDTAATIVERLSVFRFRAKVDFDIQDNRDPQDAADLIARGVPWIGAAQMEQYTPHMLNLDLQDAISMDKGCYPGQEIVARTHYKGATKRRTLRFACSEAVAVGATLSCDGRSVGSVLNSTDSELLAVVSVDRARDTLTVDEVSLSLLPLPYLDLPEPSGNCISRLSNRNAQRSA